MKFFSKIVSMSLLLFILAISITGCSAKPDVPVKSFFDAIKQQDMVKATTYLNTSNKKDALKFDDADQEKMIKAIFSKIDYKIVTVTVNGSSAIVKAKITSVDLPKVVSQTISTLLPTLMTQALSGDKTDDVKQQAAINQALLNSINDPKGPTTVTDVDIKLVKIKSVWLIEPNDDLINAMTGNFSKINDSLK